MKPTFFRSVSFLVSLVMAILFSLIVQGQDRNTYIWPVKLQKDYSKTYPVSAEALQLRNRYGQMNIESWDKNEIKVDVHITVGGQTNEYATQVLDRISILDEKTAEHISFTTKLGDWSNNGNDYNGGYEMRIDYVVHVPAKAKLYAENSFGPMNMGDYAGESELLERYGTLTGGKLSNNKALTVEYGKLVLESFSDSKLLLRYSKADISKISGNILAQFDYCNSIDLPIDNTLKQFDLKNNYTSLYLITPKDFSADYDIAANNARVTSKYSPLKEEVANKSYTTNPVIYNSNHHYAGAIGKGGGTQITIKSNFGSIRLM